jgi:hypothetical protein
MQLPPEALKDLEELIGNRDAPTYGQCTKGQFVGLTGGEIDFCTYTSPNGVFGSVAGGGSAGIEAGGSLESGVLKSNAERGQQLSGPSACTTLGAGAFYVGSVTACFGLTYTTHPDPYDVNLVDVTGDFTYNGKVTIVMTGGVGCDCTGFLPASLTATLSNSRVVKYPQPVATVVRAQNIISNGIVTLFTEGLW